jgi:hypothetical protein
MIWFSRSSLATVVCASVLVPSSGEAQRRPDLSGTWVLVEALATGPGRDTPEGSASAAPRRITATTGFGAFRCGRECTIIHKGQTFTIKDAELPDYTGKDKSQPTPAVTLRLDGRPREVQDSFAPSRQLPVTAHWDGNKVRIESRTADSVIASTQWLSLDDGQLVVVIATTLNGVARGEATFKYRKK